MSKTSLNLNPSQLQVLLIAYKFRFFTAANLARYKHVSESSIRKSLKILVDNGYLYRRYFKHYKIDRLPAIYFLNPKSMKLLKSMPELNPRVLHARYKDKTVGQGYIDHHLEIFKTYLDIKMEHPDRYTIFTKYELSEYDTFPDPQPDLYLAQSGDKPDWMIDIFSKSTQPYLIRKRIDQLIKHFEDSSDQDSYPNILLIVPTKYLEESLNRYIAKRKDERYIEDDELIVRATINPDFD